MNSNVLQVKVPNKGNEIDLFWVCNLEEDTQRCFDLIGPNPDVRNPHLQQAMINMLSAGMSIDSVSELMAQPRNTVRNANRKVVVWNGQLASRRFGQTLPARLILSIFFLQYSTLVGPGCTGRIDYRSLLHAWRRTCELTVSSNIIYARGFKPALLLLENFYDVALIYSMGDKTLLAKKRTMLGNFALDFCPSCGSYFIKAKNGTSGGCCCFCEFEELIRRSERAIANDLRRNSIKPKRDYGPAPVVV